MKNKPTFTFCSVLLALSLGAAYSSFAVSQTLAVPAAAKTQTQPGVALSDLSPTAPERHVVKKGETLWAISGLFLKSPWQWPALWGMNKEVVKNPHLIYPGQTLVLTKNGDRATLGFAGGVDGLAGSRLSANGANGDVKLSPAIRSVAIDAQPISSVQLDAVAQFLSQPLVVDEPALQGSGYVLSGPENRVYAGQGDIIYARNLPAGEENRFQLYRPGKGLKDPDTGAVLAYEAFYLGTAEMLATGDPAKLKILSSKEEMGRGDRLLPAVRDASLSYPPRALEKPVEARVMSSYSGVAFAGSNMVVTLNKGRKDGLELGHVLAIWRAGDSVADPEKPVGNSFWSRLWSGNAVERVKLPDEKYGNVIVFRLFENVAYALVLGTTLPVVVGDKVTQP